MNTYLQPVCKRARVSVSHLPSQNAALRPKPPIIRQTPFQRRHRSERSRNDEEQAIPLTGYWAEVLEQPQLKVEPTTRTTPEPPPTESPPKPIKEEQIQKARVVFGSRLAGPGQRERELQASSHNIAGIMVPPKPEEPDNCCMSGCVNCVWDAYRDELEDWADKSAQARERVAAQRASGGATGSMTAEQGMPSHVATSMDDDGGGSETNWESGLAASGKQGDLFGDIPVGIREFMRTEKMLKERHGQDKSAGG